MLRHYEALGLVRPSGRTEGGYRAYGSDDIRRIFHIESLRSLGLSLREVGRALDDPAFAPSELVGDLIARTRERIAAETDLLRRLHRIGAAEPADWADVLQTVALLQALGSDSAGRRQRAALSTVAESPVPVEALAEAALTETDPNVAGALRWALARAGAGGLARLVRGLDAPEAAVRERAVQAIAELTDETATSVLQDCLTSADVVVRRGAALALGARGGAAAVPTLIDMIVEEANDVDAADCLSTLAEDPALTERIATGLVDRLTAGAAGSAAVGDGIAGSSALGGGIAGSPARRRLTQALAGIPGDRTTQALVRLAEDDDRGVALTATYLLRLRGHGDRP